MRKIAHVALGISIVFFLILTANVTLGAMKQPVFLSDVWEMLILFISSVFFVAFILIEEALADNSNYQV